MADMLFSHVAITPAPDYVTRRAPLRAAHLARLMDLRARGFVVAGGPAPDGRTADIFYRVPEAPDLARVVEEDPYFKGGAWTAYTSTLFEHFLQPGGRAARGDGRHRPRRGRRCVGRDRFLGAREPGAPPLALRAVTMSDPATG